MNIEGDEQLVIHFDTHNYKLVVSKDHIHAISFLASEGSIVSATQEGPHISLLMEIANTSYNEKRQREE